MKLRKGRKHAWQTATEIADDADRILRRAFGRTGLPQDSSDMKEAGRFVSLCQSSDHWYYCPCKQEGGRYPTLYPRGNHHLVRHPDFPQHHEECDFFLEPREQKHVVKSHVRPDPQHRFMLARAFASAAEVDGGGVHRVSQSVRRNGLATMLFEVMTRSGLQTRTSQNPPSLKDQWFEIKRAAGEVYLSENVTVKDCLKTSPAYFNEIERVIFRCSLDWGARARPHGILIFPATAATQDLIYWDNGPPLPVLGSVTIFGESPEEIADVDHAVEGRCYMAIALVAQAAPNGELEVIRAYLHRCLAKNDFMLVDSGLEMETFWQINSIRGWMAERGVTFSVEKPLFDIGAGEDYSEDRNENDGEVVAREVVIPDFIVRSNDAPGNKTVIVETMGFADDAYRSRKVRMHEKMSMCLDSAPVVEHDPHFPQGLARQDRDESFRKWLIRMLLDRA